MNTVKDVSQYPWLCSTVSRLDDDSDNIVCPNEEDTDNVLIQDAYEKFGIICVYYRVTEDLLRDKLFGEDQLKYIQRSWYFNGYVEQLPPNVRSYQLQGIWGEDVVRMFASIDAFNYYSTYGGKDKNTPEVYEEQPPSIGDIVYIKYSDTYYEIVNVKPFAEGTTFLSTPMTWFFHLRVWHNNHDDVDHFDQNPDKMEEFRSYNELAETFDLDLKADENGVPTSRVEPESDMLAINKDLVKDTDIEEMPKKDPKIVEPTDNVKTNVICKDKEIKEGNPDYYDPFGGW